jgi:hypothetical protein|tara:strand:- start:371 stop:763 length:393 start_codon:yes stop_codon:yes gene_type:complete
MNREPREIASSINRPVPVVGQFLDETGAKDAAIDFAKNFVKSRFNKKDNNNNKEETLLENNENQNISAVEKTRNLLNRINQTGLTADLSGVGFEKTFGDKNQGINTTVFGRQDFGAPAQYGARVGFNYKF